MSPRLDSRWGGSFPFPGREFHPLKAPGLTWRTKELCQIVEEAIELYRQEEKPLPPATAGRDYANKLQSVA